MSKGMTTEPVGLGDFVDFLVELFAWMGCKLGYVFELDFFYFIMKNVLDLYLSIYASDRSFVWADFCASPCFRYVILLAVMGVSVILRTFDWVFKTSFARSAGVWLFYYCCIVAGMVCAYFGVDFVIMFVVDQGLHYGHYMCMTVSWIVTTLFHFLRMWERVLWMKATRRHSPSFWKVCSRYVSLRYAIFRGRMVACVIKMMAMRMKWGDIATRHVRYDRCLSRRLLRVEEPFLYTLWILWRMHHYETWWFHMDWNFDGWYDYHYVPLRILLLNVRYGSVYRHLASKEKITRIEFWLRRIACRDWGWRPRDWWQREGKMRSRFYVGGRKQRFM